MGRKFCPLFLVIIFRCWAFPMLIGNIVNVLPILVKKNRALPYILANKFYRKNPPYLISDLLNFKFLSLNQLTLFPPFQFWCTLSTLYTNNHIAKIVQWSYKGKNKVLIKILIQEFRICNFMVIIWLFNVLAAESICIYSNLILNNISIFF